jgi:hypothetical protein
MPRRTRVHLDGVPLHIVQRGHNREPCFFAEEDYDLKGSDPNYFIHSKMIDEPKLRMAEANPRPSGYRPIKVIVLTILIVVPIVSWVLYGATPGPVTATWQLLSQVRHAKFDKAPWSEERAKARAPVLPAPLSARSGPMDRYTIKDDEVFDKATGLTWARCSVGQDWNAVDGCVGRIEMISWRRAIVLLKAGWRLPSLRELETLEVEGGSERMKMDTLAFPGTDLARSYYWSMDGDPVHKGIFTDALISQLDFADGRTLQVSANDGGGAVRFVRGTMVIK